MLNLVKNFVPRYEAPCSLRIRLVDKFTDSQSSKDPVYSLRGNDEIAM